ncbi:hypothetical protein [Deinococcus sp. YIM 77859]|uniref:hypothetical protein n=1 Tax=Deinococcus sp. YIM 77859 TaxID=1540221 RepID=UPI000558E986|nr:hypothetical protein [Deinococcus sp. YIM 77859]
MTTLDSSAIREVERLTREADPVITVPGEARGVYYLREADGSLTRHAAELDIQDVTAYDLDTVQRRADREHTAGDLEAVFVTDSAVVVQASSPTDRWTTTLALPLHPAFKRVQSFAQLTKLDQKTLVRLLRTELGEHVQATVISTFATLRFTSSSDGTSSVKPASTALDSRIVRQVRADAGQDVPDTITLHVPVYDIPEARADSYPVTVYVEYDHDAEAFLLLAVHNDLRAAQESAVHKIINNLKDSAEDRYPVYYGKPS